MLIQMLWTKHSLSVYGRRQHDSSITFLSGLSLRIRRGGTWRLRNIHGTHKEEWRTRRSARAATHIRAEDQPKDMHCRASDRVM